MIYYMHVLNLFMIFFIMIIENIFLKLRKDYKIYKKPAVLFFPRVHNHYGHKPFKKQSRYEGEKSNSDVRKHSVTLLVSNVLAVRYILVGGLLGGGLIFIKWMKYFPDFSWFNNLRDAITSNEKCNTFFKTLEILEDKFRRQNVDEIESRIKELQHRLCEMHAQYKEKIQRIDEENKKLRSKLYYKGGYLYSKKKIHKSLIDMYFDIMDDLKDYDKKFQFQYHAPKVVVIGDKYSGETSVVEMIIKAKIFPRKGVETISKIPIKININEGPYHIAKFKDDDKEYDLTEERDIKELRDQLVYYMFKIINKTDINDENEVSITVEGPNLHRMVLEMLPLTNYKDKNGKNILDDYSNDIVEEYLSNPNKIIVCVENGCINSNQSSIRDLVSRVDPQRKRTTFVINLVDLSGYVFSDQLKLENILADKLDQLKSLGSFAVMAGSSKNHDSVKEILQYEEDFFNKSGIAGVKSIRSQLTTGNLSKSLSENFWKMMKETVVQQAEVVKASLINHKLEWKNLYRGLREMDRDELFKKAQNEILDEVMSLREVTDKQWEEMITKKIWERISLYIFENIYVPSAQYDNIRMFNTNVDIKLFEWANKLLPELSIEAGWEVLKDKFSQLILKNKCDKTHDDIFGQLKLAVLQDIVSQHTWEPKAHEVLRVIQLNALEDYSIQDKAHWDSAILFLENSLKDKINEVDNQIKTSVGPGTVERWLYWKQQTKDQNKKRAIKSELEKNISFDYLSFTKTDEPMRVKNKLLKNGLDVELNDIISVWQLLQRKLFLKNRMSMISSCRGHYQNHNLDMDVKCGDIVLFWRLQKMLKVTANTLRQQIMHKEIQHLDKEVEQVLESYNRDQNKKQVLLTGRRVELAEELRLLKKIHEKLEKFIQSLN